MEKPYLSICTTFEARQFATNLLEDSDVVDHPRLLPALQPVVFSGPELSPGVLGALGQGGIGDQRQKNKKIPDGRLGCAQTVKPNNTMGAIQYKLSRTQLNIF